MTLRMERKHVEAIQDEGRKSYPHECCGFLVGHAEGDAHRVTHVWPAENENVSDEARRRYWISPEVTLRTELAARKEKLDVLGVYHSHPDRPDRPSEFDRNHALPGWSYVVFSVTRGEPGPLGSWLLAEDRSAFHPEDVRIEEDSE